MPSKKILKIWLQKFIYGLLIFCVGGLGSLTYFDGFLPGHEQGRHPYHLSIFEEPAHNHDHHLPSPPEPKVLAQQMNLRLAGRFRGQADFILAQQHLTSGLLQFFQSGLSDGYLLTVACGDIFNNITLFGSIGLAILTGRSALLPLPDPPPQLNLA
jgi:hypothetical protein